MYDHEQLDALVKSDLVKLGEYLGLPEKLNMKMLKEEMIEAILEYLKPKEVVEVEPPMSARVRRISES